jgi:hypothetical protein
MAIFPISQNKIEFFMFPIVIAIIFAVMGTTPELSIGLSIASSFLSSYFSLIALVSLIDPELDYFTYGIPLEKGNETRPSNNEWGSTSPYVYSKTVRELAIGLTTLFFEYQGNLQAVIGISMMFTLVKVADAAIVARHGGERAHQWKKQATQAFWIGVMVGIRSYVK